MRSLFLISALVQLGVHAQIGSVIGSSAPSTTPAPTACNACYAEARLLQQLDFSNSKDGNTSLVLNLDFFTWNPAQTNEITNAATEIILPTDGRVSYSDLDIPNPTMHIFVPSWVIVGQISTAGACSATTIYTQGDGSLYNVPIPRTASANFPVTAETSLVSIISGSYGLLTCSTREDGVVVPMTVDKLATQTVSSQSSTSTEPSNSSQPGTKSPSSSASSSSATAATDAPSSAPSTDSGLSASAKIGVGVGVGVGGALGLALIGFFFWKRSARDRGLPEKHRPNNGVGVAAGEPGVAVD